MVLFMGILKEMLFGSTALGVYLAINNKILFCPKTIPSEKLITIHKAFPKDFPVAKILINQSSLLGSYIATNSNGILVPIIMSDSELDEMRSIFGEFNLSMNVSNLPLKDNAIGNLILCNDHGAVISKDLAGEVNLIKDVLDVEVLILNYASTHLPGSAGVANNLGCCVHPLVTDEEVEMIQDILKVPVDVSTVNMGNPFLRAGAIINDFGGIFGKDTSGPEMMRMTNVLQLD